MVEPLPPVNIQKENPGAKPQEHHREAKDNTYKSAKPRAALVSLAHNNVHGDRHQERQNAGAFK